MTKPFEGDGIAEWLIRTLTVRSSARVGLTMRPAEIRGTQLQLGVVAE